MSIFKELLGESITDEVAAQLETKLQESINTAIESAKAETTATVTQSMNESIDALKDTHATELQNLTESFKEYVAKDIHEAEVNSLKESTNQRIAEYVDEINTLKESANKYAEYVTEQLTEKAEKYIGECMQEYQNQHAELFERVEKNNKMESLFETVKQTFESFGFGLDKDAAYTSLQEKVNTLTEAVNAEKEKVTLTESKLAQKELDILKEKELQKATDGMSLNERERITKLSESINAKNIDEFKGVLNIVIANTITESKTAVDEANKKLNENVNTNDNTPTVENDNQRDSQLADVVAKMV